MTYEDFTNTISTEQLSTEEFYKQLVKHKDSILLDIQRTSQQHVATKLRMSQTKLSHILNLLKLPTLGC